MTVPALSAGDSSQRRLPPTRSLSQLRSRGSMCRTFVQVDVSKADVLDEERKIAPPNAY
jgi:hypothetical protein